MKTATKPAKNTIKRTQAGRILDELALLVAQLEEGSYAKETPLQIANRMRTILTASMSLEGGTIIIPRKCNGEAHSNPHIDNCGVCMPNWGWISSPTKVK